MPRLIAGSIARKVAVLVIAIVGLLLLTETRILDSGPWRVVSEEPSPEPGLTLRFSATAYCKGTTTASGVAVRTGIAAADPALLPVGSVVNVSTQAPKYDGVYTIMDTGPKVQGRVLDLYMWSCYEALEFGRRGIDVTVLRLGWDPTASSPTIIERLFRGREAARRVPAPQRPPPAGVPPAIEHEDAAGADESDDAPDGAASESPGAVPAAADVRERSATTPIED